MTEQQELIKLIIDDKKKANTYDRYPIRFLFMRLSSTAEADLSNLISELVNLSKNKDNKINNIKFIDLYDLLSYEDGWISKSQILKYINELDPTKDYFITGFSELIRFYSRNDLEALIISFMTNIESISQKNKQRIYFVCYSLFEKIEIELRSNSRNESINPILKPSFIIDDNSDQICVFYANSSFDGKYFNNKISTSTEWLSLYKAKGLNLNNGIVCISDTLVTLYEKAKPDNFVLIEKLDSYYSLLTNMFKVKLNYCKQELFEEDFWKFLFDNCFKHNCYNLVEIAHKLLKTTNIDENNFIELFNKSDLSYKKILYIYLLEERNRINYSEYLISILDKSLSNNFLTFNRDIVSFVNLLFSETYFKARRFFVGRLDSDELSSADDMLADAINNAFYSFLQTKIFNVLITKYDLFSISVNNFCVKFHVNEDYFRAIFREFYDSFLSKILTCKTKQEKKLVILLIKESLIEINEVNGLYLDLFNYIGNNTSVNIGNSLQWIASYLHTYRLSKIFDTPMYDYNVAVRNNAANFPQWYSNSNLKLPLEALNKKIYDFLIVLDGVGAEYFEFIISYLKDKGKNISYSNICKCVLPSITTSNKAILEGKYDEWNVTFDRDIIHGKFYHPEDVIPSALDVIKELIDRLIRKYPGKRVALIADHGATVASKIIEYNKKYNFESDHEGRCAKVNDFINIADSEDYYKYTSNFDGTTWIFSLNEISLKDKPKRESHGGATVEEVVVPCIIFSDSKDKEDIDYNLKVLSPPISGLNHKVTIEILPHIEEAPILEEQSGIRHIMSLVGNNMWECSISEIKTQNVKIIINGNSLELLIQGTMGASIGGDGFDD
ncbi:MAG: BREX-4 system phosphatase PglZ [Clostridia bacterium]|nr:BREX-4 system phosphatase PglZ [Clostridia bacterium]